jgi:hypothetical protein
MPEAWPEGGVAVNLSLTITCLVSVVCCLQRLDNSLEDFSYRKCLSSLFPGEMTHVTVTGTVTVAVTVTVAITVTVTVTVSWFGPEP